MTDRTPPHDDVAERFVLGACMTKPKLVGTVSLLPSDFYHPVHEMIWDAIVVLTGKSKPADFPAVRAHMMERGQARQIDGGLLLHEMVEQIIAPDNVGHHAEIVADRAQRRRLIDELQASTQDAYESEDPAPDLVSRAEGRLSKIARADDAGMADLMNFDEFMAQPLLAEDWVIPELMDRGDRLVITGTEGAGKALALDTPIPTPTGWTTMGDLQPGDEVLGMDGLPAWVTRATDVMYDRQCYRVKFSDGSEIVADAEHQWLTETLAARESEAKAARRGPLKPRGTDQSHKRRHFPSVVTTQQISETLMARGGFAVNHSVRTCKPLDLPEAKLLIDPYALGAWLGDGSSLHAEIACHPDDREIVDRIATTDPIHPKGDLPFMWAINRGGYGGLRAETFANRLRVLGVHGNKHIPQHYLRASFDQRLALLQGLMDTDGTVVVGKVPSCEFSVTSLRLATDVHELLSTFGIKCQMREGDAVLDGRVVSKRYRLWFQTDLPVFHLKRKADRLQPLRTQRAKHRYIVAVEPVESVPVRCIQVENEDHMYLAGSTMIPTHNSIWMRQMAVCAAAGVHPFLGTFCEPKTVLFVDAENPAKIMVKTMARMRDAAANKGRPVDPNRLWIRRRPEGVNLADPAERLWLKREAQTVNADLLCIGPAYKLYFGGKGEREEDLARQVTVALDMVRDAANCAVILEHHSPHQGSNDRARNVRPIGSSLWLRWPEFGMGIRLADEEKAYERRLMDVVAWRGARDEREWPKQLIATTNPLAMPWTDGIYA